MNVLQLYPDDAQRLYAALAARPRFPGRPEIIEDPLTHMRPAAADSERSAPIDPNAREGEGEGDPQEGSCPAGRGPGGRAEVGTRLA